MLVRPPQDDHMAEPVKLLQGWLKGFEDLQVAITFGTPDVSNRVDLIS
jgi:hypothetical protein